MNVDLVIENGKLVLPSGILEAAIAINKGKIAQISKSPHLPLSQRLLDAGGNFVIPGVIDSHVHFWDPGFTSREDWSTGTMSASAGGVTTVIEMPTTSPPTITSSAFEEKKKNAGEKAYVDFALHAGTTPGTIDNIPTLSSKGAASFKMFIAENVREIERMDEGSTYDALTRIKENHSVMCVHAESEIIPYLRRKLQSAGRIDPAAHTESRPGIAEINAIVHMLLLAWETAAHVHFCHLSTSVGTRLIRKAKNKHLSISAETCPQYLLFNTKDYSRLGPYLKVNPPIRTTRDQLGLWRAIQNGVLDLIASDHCPFLCKEKEIGWRNIWDAGAGVPGVETMLPLMLAEGVNKGRLSMLRLVKVLCENPARIFGLYPRKGQLAVGADADIVIVDMKKRNKISIKDMHTKGEFTPYEGREVKGLPVITIVRGKVVSENGSIVGKPGDGVFTARSQ